MLSRMHTSNFTRNTIELILKQPQSSNMHLKHKTKPQYTKYFKKTPLLERLDTPQLPFEDSPNLQSSWWLY